MGEVTGGGEVGEGGEARFVSCNIYVSSSPF